MIDDVKVRFESKFRRQPSGCWEWGAARFARGYGAFQMEGKVRKAHRVAYEIYVGALPAGAFICHRCDNPACVNPGHLFVGTAKDNNDDMRAKGRARYPGPKNPPRGVSHHKAVLDPSKVAQIRARAGSERHKDLAMEFGVSKSLISEVARRTIWREVPC